MSMKRYLTGYSKGVLTIRDRKTGEFSRQSFVDPDTAEEIQQKIRKMNTRMKVYKASKVNSYYLSDLELEQI